MQNLGRIQPSTRNGRWSSNWRGRTGACSSPARRTARPPPKWLAARRGDIEPADQAFIKASVQAERATARNRQRLQAAVGVLMLGTIAGLLGRIFKDEINNVWFEYFTVRPHIAANFTPYVLKPEAERALKPGDPFRE